MKLSILDMTQSILSSMNSDAVNSISDTEESRQVAECIKTAYFNIIARAQLPEHTKLFHLDSSGVEESPVLMFSPSNVCKIEWIKYDISEIDGEVLYEYVYILPIQAFTDMVHRFNPEEDNIESFQFDSFNFYYRTDRRPTHCTLIGNHNIIFDAYNNTMDGTLQASKTLCFGQTTPEFTMANSFIPDLDDQLFPLLLNEAKTLAFFEIKQTPHSLSALESKRQWTNLNKNKRLIDSPSDFCSLPDYGRR